MRKLMLILLCAGPSPLAAEGITRPAELMEDVGMRFSDYPDEALRGDFQGLTSVKFEIGEDGSVVADSCQVTVTSGSRLLDRQSCKVIEKRFRFQPALEGGVAVREVQSRSVFWRIPALALPVDPTLARRLERRMGQCVAKEAPEDADQLVDTPLGSPEQASAAERLKAKAPKCLNDLEGVSPVQLAGTVSEALMTKRFLGTGPKPSAGIPPLEPRNGMEAFGQCVARREPAAVRELIDSEPTSQDEAVATAKLVPQMKPCITSGTTLTFTKTAIRALVAIALYRDAAHAAGAQR